MTETIAPKNDGRAQPLDERWGFSFGAGVTRSVATSFTEGGMGLDLQLKCDIAESLHELYSSTVKLSLDMTNGKYLPGSGYDPAGDTSGVPGYSAKHGSLMLGIGRIRRSILSYRKDTSIGTAFRSENTPLLGIGWRRQAQGDQTVDGVASSFDDTDSKTIDVANSQRWAFETRSSGRWPVYTLGMDFMLGTQFAGADSRYNRMFLKLGISLTVGNGDAATDTGDISDTTPGPMGTIYAYEVLAHSFISRLLMNETLSNPQSDLNDYLGDDEAGGSGRGSGANIPLFTSASAFNGAFDGITPLALRMDEGTLATIAIIRGLGGALFLASASEAGSIGGGVDVMSSLRLGAFALAGIHTPAARQTLEAENGSSVRKKEAALNAINFAANTLLMLLGAEGESTSAMKIGASANMPVAGTPDPVESGLVERTDYRYVLSLTNADGGQSRGGILIHQSFRDLPLFSSVSLLSPSLLPGNTANHVSQDEPYTNIRANSDVDAAMGVEWRTRHLRAFLGVDTKAIFGGLSSTQAGIGATAGVDLLLGTGENWGVSLGARATAVQVLPDGGRQLELIPGLGLMIYQTTP